MIKLSVNEAQDAMGFRVALQAALANFLLAMDPSVTLSEEEQEARKRRLPTVGLALKHFEETKKKVH